MDWINNNKEWKLAILTPASDLISDFKFLHENLQKIKVKI